MVTTILITSILIIIIIALIPWRRNSKHRKLPPSLSRLPIIGNIHHMIAHKRQKKETHEIFTEISESLGPIFTFWFGDRPIIFISDYFTAKKLLHSHDCSGRPQRTAGKTISKNFQGNICLLKSGK